MANMRTAYTAAHSTRSRRLTPVNTAASGTRWNSRNGAEFFQSTRHCSTGVAAAPNAPPTYWSVGTTVATVCRSGCHGDRFCTQFGSEVGERALEQVFLLELVQLGRAAGRAARLHPADVDQPVVVAQQAVQALVDEV